MCFFGCNIHKLVGRDCYSAVKGVWAVLGWFGTITLLSQADMTFEINIHSSLFISSTHTYNWRCNWTAQLTECSESKMYRPEETAIFCWSEIVCWKINKRGKSQANPVPVCVVSSKVTSGASEWMSIFLRIDCALKTRKKHWSELWVSIGPALTAQNWFYSGGNN